MSKERVVVRFAQSWRGYSKDECAGFDEAQAKALVDGKVAELVMRSKTPAKAAATTGKGSGKSGTAKADKTGGDTPPAGADNAGGDDNEPKP